MSYPASSLGDHSDYTKIWSAISAIVVDVSSVDMTLTQSARAIFIGGAGNLACRLVGDDTDITFTGLVAGVVYPFAIAIVRHTSTTVTNATLLF